MSDAGANLSACCEAFDKLVKDELVFRTTPDGSWPGGWTTLSIAEYWHGEHRYHFTLEYCPKCGKKLGVEGRSPRA